MAMKITVHEAHKSEALSFCEQGVKAAFPQLPLKAVKLVGSWYENEGAEGDFDSTGDLAAHIKDDIDNMLDAASAKDKAYIKELLYPSNKKALIRRALKSVFPAFKIKSKDSADGYWYVVLEGSALVPRKEMERLEQKLQEFLGKGIEASVDEDVDDDILGVEFFWR